MRTDVSHKSDVCDNVKDRKFNVAECVRTFICNPLVQINCYMHATILQKNMHGMVQHPDKMKPT